MIVDLRKFPTGFCDRLRAVTYGVAVARMRGDRTILLRNERRTPECPFQILDYCRFEGFDCREWAGDEPAEFLMGPRNSIPCRARAAFHAPPDMRSDPERLFSEWLASYELLRPTPIIATAVQALGVDQGCLGIHVRMTDKVRRQVRRKGPGRMSLAVAELDGVRQRLVEGARAYLRRNSLSRVFVASDHLAGREFIVTELARDGFETLAVDAKFDATRKRHTGGEAFATDLFALARCCDVIGTVISGVVFTAARMNGRDIRFLASDTCW